MITTLASLRRCPWVGPLALALAAAAPAQNTPSRPKTYAALGVRFEADPEAATHTLILRDGVIAAILPPEAAVPEDAWLVDGEGLLALPAFVDAWCTSCVGGEEPVADKDRPVGTDANVRIDMRSAGRKGIRPAFRAASALQLDDDKVESMRAQGFGLVLAAPSGELLAGFSSLASLLPAPPREQVVRDAVYQQAAFRASGRGYPSTLMAYHAQLRQFFLDAKRHGILAERWARGAEGPRPAWDPDLDVGVELLAGRPLVCTVDSARDIHRWLRLADELGFTLAAIGGGDGAWKVADLLSQRGVAVVLDLDWGTEPEEIGPKELEEEEPPLAPYDYREPRGVRAEKRRLWEERRDNALRLAEAGVPFVFGSGKESAKKLLGKVRTLIEAGLPREQALEALTTRAAQFCGVEGRYGRIEEGLSATLCLWSGDPLTDEKARVAWSFVEGYGHEFELASPEEEEVEPAEGLDLSGTWTLTVDADDDEMPPLTLELEMDEEGDVSGTAKTRSPIDDSPLSATVEGSLGGSHVSLEMTFQVAGMEIDIEVSGELDGDEMTGTLTLGLPGGEQENAFTATRRPGGIR